MKSIKKKIVASFIILNSINAIQAQDNIIINATVSGKIIDEVSNEGLAGAKISIKNITNSTTTDINGDFGLITGQNLPFTVTVEIAGYESKDITISERNVLIKLHHNYWWKNSRKYRFF